MNQRRASGANGTHEGNGRAVRRVRSGVWLAVAVIAAVWLAPTVVRAQALGEPDRGQPGDTAIQAYLARETARIEAGLAGDLKSREAWESRRARYREEYLYMLGLWPLPERTPLRPQVTGRVDGPGYVVEKLHYQSRPGLYVTGNLFRPAEIKAGEKLPAVLYVCGHSSRGRNGGKAAFQSHGIWFARHGYVCLIVDTLQLGEIGATHHGTYSEGRWWWQSRGYTSAGVECWNGVRGIDYLIERPEVDAERIAVTGISGGGAATFWIAAADDRVQAAVPISGMADLAAYVPNRVINGHCDCMFLVNTFEWPWTRIAALVAPRPMAFINSDQDRIFPMDANDRVSAALERVYSLYEAGDRFETLVSVGGHDYRADIRQGTYRFLNSWMRNDPRIVLDGEVDLVIDSRTNPKHPIEPERLRVFATDADLPKDELNTTIDRHFVPAGRVEPPADEAAAVAWREKLRAELRRVTFRKLADRPAPAKALPTDKVEGPWAPWRLETEPGVVVDLYPPRAERSKRVRRIELTVSLADDPAPKAEPQPGAPAGAGDGEVERWVVSPRGAGRSRWTKKNPPNYVERSLALLGDTAAGGQVRDVAAVLEFLAAREREPGRTSEPLPIEVTGRGAAGLIGAYAALWTDAAAGVKAIDPPTDHESPEAPALLNVARVADLPTLLGLLAPKPLTLTGVQPDSFATTGKIYERSGAEAKFRVAP